MEWTSIASWLPYGGRRDDPSCRGGVVGLAILLAMAMFVLVVDMSLMNVSISGGGPRPRHDGQRGAVRDRARGTRLAAFILIGSKIGDLIGRKRA